MAPYFFGKGHVLALGRPRKYTKIIAALEEDGLYTPSGIARFAEENGFLTDDDLSSPEKKRLAMQRIRICFGRVSDNHKFPDEGDGMVTIRGQAPVPGWFGWRWQTSYK